MLVVEVGYVAHKIVQSYNKQDQVAKWLKLALCCLLTQCALGSILAIRNYFRGLAMTNRVASTSEISSLLDISNKCGASMFIVYLSLIGLGMETSLTCFIQLAGDIRFRTSQAGGWLPCKAYST